MVNELHMQTLDILCVLSCLGEAVVNHCEPLLCSWCKDVDILISLLVVFHCMNDLECQFESLM